MTVVLTITLITLGQAPLASTFTVLLITIIGPILLLIVKLNHLALLLQVHRCYQGATLWEQIRPTEGCRQ